MTDSSLDITAVPPVSAPAPAAETAEPPAPASDALVTPAPVETVESGDAAAAVGLDAAQTVALDKVVASFVDAITDLDVHDQTFAAKVTDIQKLGDEGIKASAAVSNRLLDKPLAAMSTGGVTEASEVSRSLVSLRRTIEDLDPARQGDLLSPRRLFGLIPFGDRLVDYFQRYQSSQGNINAVVNSLHRGQEELSGDNTSIDQEKANLWQVMGRLRQYAYLAQQLDKALSAKIAEIEAIEPERARVLKEDLLFPVRQKVQDLLTQLAVSVQGYLALDLIRHNNVELIKGVDRATTTTVSALRTAVIVAQALSDQKLVLDQVTALNTVTGNLIESTSEMLHQQSARVSEQAASSSVELAKLQAAFANVYATMDEIDAFKIKALDSLSKTIDALSSEIEQSHKYLDRETARDAGSPIRGIDTTT
jgi:uncharacterized protein YaaN involved in tellurite resistance